MDGLIVEPLSWWFVEGLSKCFLFLSFWFVTPAVLPAAIVRRIAGPVSFVTALYTVALVAALANWCLPSDWKFVPDRLPTRTQEELNQELIETAKKAAEWHAGKSGQAVADLTHSKSLEDYTIWKKQYDRRKGPRQVATVLIILVTLGIARFGQSLLRSQLPVVPPTTGTTRGSEQGQTAVVIGAWLFAAGTALDFIKWWFTHP